MKRIIICILLWTLVIGWMGVLFYMSSRPASVSGKMSGDILEEIYDRADEKTVDKEVFDKDLFVRANQGRIRRTAHILMYSVLGLLTAIASAFTLEKAVKGLIISVVITLSYSLIDEAVQLVTPGRSFEWSDYGRNALGSAIGIIVVFAVFVTVKRIRSK